MDKATIKATSNGVLLQLFQTLFFLLRDLIGCLQKILKEG